MSKLTLTPLGAMARGVLAGSIGTLVMDLYWYALYKQGGGEDSFLVWEFAAGLADWNDAPAPAQVGKRLYEGLLQRPLPASNAALTANVMHWAYGLTWGGLFGLVQGTIQKPALPVGVAFGAGVWKSDYLILPLTGIYKPIWEYDLPTLGKDLAAHLIYGITTAGVFRALTCPNDA